MDAQSCCLIEGLIKMTYDDESGQSVVDADVRGRMELVGLSVDQLVREYNDFAKSSSGNLLGLASTVLAAEDLGRRDRERFYADVKLDPKGSTARKLMAIGQQLPRFQPYLNIIPNTWTTLYELARLEDEEFKIVVDSGVLHPLVTLREIDEVRGRASAKPQQQQQFMFHVDLNRIGTQKVQADFVCKLKALLDEFGIEWEPMAPKREKELSRLLAESDQQNQAA
jgi:hypothetical protein